MANNAAWNTATTVKANRATQAVSLNVAATAAVASFSFSDGFETGDISTTLSDGRYFWDGAPTTDSTRIYIKAGSNPETGGNYVMSHNYPAGQRWTEKEWTLPGVPDVWIKLWMMVPTNYTHLGPAATNNQKFLTLWTDGTGSGNGTGATVWWGLWANSEGTGSNIAYTYNPGDSSAFGYTGYTSFITAPADLGRWMQIVFRVKAAATRTSSDGIIQMWRRWDGETNFTQFHNKLNADLRQPYTGIQGFQRGNFLGYFNQPFDEDTEFLLDDIEISSDGSSWVQ